jgi:hypothetical protein
LVQELQTPGGVQRWIGTNEHESRRDPVVEAMRVQFKPPLDAPLDRSVVKHLLEENVAYWPHAFALALMAAVDGKFGPATEYLNAIRERGKATGNTHIMERAKQLEDLLAGHDPVRLRERLRRGESAVLKSMKLED